MADAQKQTVEVYGEGANNVGNVTEWCRLSKWGRTNIHNEKWSRRPSL